MKRRTPWLVSVRQSLIAVALLGAVTCAASIFALMRLVAATNAQRIERGREFVAQQLDVVRRLDELSPSATDGRTPMPFGMKAGVLAAGEAPDETELADLDPALRALVAQSVARTAGGEGAPVVLDEPWEDTTILAGARRVARGGVAWVAYRMSVPPWVHTWRILGVTLGLAGLALVLASAHLAVSVQRGATALKASLASLGHDLAAPVRRPPLRELADVADGIALLSAQLRRAQEEQQRLGRELAARERLAGLGRVAAGVAHEVRNPLASIKLRLDLARLEVDPGSPLVQELSSASEEIARLDRFVADLLTVSGRRTGPRVHTDLGALARRRVELCEPWARERGVRVVVDGDGFATVDPDSIGRVIDNLVRNAVEASSRGDVVNVEIACGPSVASLTVIDRGPGLAPEHTQALFEPFFTTKADGTGLGLALSRAIAAAHGGNLDHKRVGGTTRFELTLPRADDAEVEENGGERP